MHTIMTKAVHQPITTKVTTVRKQIPITFRPKINTFESFSIQPIKSVPIPTSRILKSQKKTVAITFLLLN